MARSTSTRRNQDNAQADPNWSRDDCAFHRPVSSSDFSTSIHSVWAGTYHRVDFFIRVRPYQAIGDRDLEIIPSRQRSPPTNRRNINRLYQINWFSHISGVPLSLLGRFVLDLSKTSDRQVGTETILSWFSTGSQMERFMKYIALVFASAAFATLAAFLRADYLYGVPSN